MIGEIINRMTQTNKHDTKRINHALKVYGIARSIACCENVSKQLMQTIEIAAILHDIAIRYCEDTYNSCSGKLQEKHGPKIAKEILDDFEISEDCKNRVLYLIAHHHTYNNIDGIDYRIIIEADFLVNYDEGNINKKAFLIAYNRYFKTSSAKTMAKTMFHI